MGDASPSRAVRFGKNMTWQVLGQLTLVMISIFLIPSIVLGLGKQNYALYGLLGLICGHIFLLNLGSGSANLKYISESIGSGNKNQLAATVRLSTWMHGGLALLGGIVVFLAREFIITRGFDVDPQLVHTAVWVVGCAAIAAPFYSLTNHSVSVFQGLQRFDLANLATLCQSGLFICGSFLLIKLGKGIESIAVLFVAVNAALCVIFWFVRRRVLAPIILEANGDFADKPSGFVKYCAASSAAQVAWSATFQWDKFLIGAFLPISELTYYFIPAFILQKFWILPKSVSMTAFPLISELAGEGDEKSLQKVYNQCGQLVLWIVVPGFIVLALFAPQLLTLWLNPEFSDKATWPLRFLVLGYLFHFIAMMPSTAAYGTGKPEWDLYWLFSQALLCITAWFYLIPRYEIAGAALGFAVAQGLAGFGFILFGSSRILGMSFFNFFRGIVLRPLSAGALLLVCLWPIRHAAYGWVGLISLSAASAVFYYGAGYYLLKKEDKETLLYLLREFAKKIGAARQPR